MALTGNWTDKQDWTPNADGDLVQANDVNSIAHAVITLEDRSDAHDREMDSINASITLLEGGVSGVQNTVSGLAQGLSGISGQISDLQSSLDEKVDKNPESGNIVIGTDAVGTGEGSVSIGKMSMASGGSTAIGKTVTASNKSITAPDYGLPPGAQPLARFCYAVGIGQNASASGGVAIGDGAKSTEGGGAVGVSVETEGGGAIGSFSKSENGGAVGNNAITSNGFAGGMNAQTVLISGSEKSPINAIQLGEGINQNDRTLQVYSYQLLDSAGHIPMDRIVLTDNEAGKYYQLTVSNGVLGVKEV